MTSHKQACDEVIQFLEDFQGIPLDLPYAVIDHWQRAVAEGRTVTPDWAKAIDSCNCIAAVLRGLRSSDGDFGRLDGAQGRVSILLGAMHFGQKNWTAASYYFEQGVRHLQNWDYAAFESLAYYGRTLTHKQERYWPGALEAAQRGLDAIHNVPAPDRSIHTKRLQRRIENQINSITEASTRDTTKTPERPIPIPIVSDIAAGLGVIAEHNIDGYLLLDDDHNGRADFGVNVVGDSMNRDGILPRDMALIRQQPKVEKREIAAVVITTSKGSEGVLKRYHVEERKGKQHWFLESSNPASEHLVVIPRGANAVAIKALYDNAIRSGKMRIRYIEGAELVVAGKYVGLVRTR